MSAGEQIKLLLGRRNLTQSSFAAAIGISRARLNNYITGRSEPDCTTLCRIADAFQISVDHLLGREVSSPACRREALLHDFRRGTEKPSDSGEWMPLYRAQSPGSPFSQDSGEALGWIMDTRREAAWDWGRQKPYALLMADDSLAPDICRGDVVFVRPQIFLNPYSAQVLEDGFFAVRLRRSDMTGLLIARCAVSDDRLICYGESPDRPFAVLTVSNLLHAPLVGKVSGLWRSFPSFSSSCIPNHETGGLA